MDLANESSAVSGPPAPDRLSTLEPFCLSLPHFLSSTPKRRLPEWAAAANVQEIWIKLKENTRYCGGKKGGKRAKNPVIIIRQILVEKFCCVIKHLAPRMMRQNAKQAVKVLVFMIYSSWFAGDNSHKLI